MMTYEDFIEMKESLKNDIAELEAEISKIKPEIARRRQAQEKKKREIKTLEKENRKHWLKEKIKESDISECEIDRLVNVGETYEKWYERVKEDNLIKFYETGYRQGAKDFYRSYGVSGNSIKWLAELGDERLKNKMIYYKYHKK